MNYRSKIFIKKSLAFLIILSIIAQMCLTKDVLASTSKSIEFNGDGYVITYNVDNKWENNYKISVLVKNTSSDIIHNWCLSFALEGKINNIWNAKIDENQNNKYYTISGQNYNQDISSNQTVSFEFTVSSNTINIPDVFFLKSEKVVANNDEYSVDYIVSNDWSSGFTGQISILNKSEKCFKDWCIEFDWDNNIDNIWNANIISHNGNHYVIGYLSYNQNIEVDNKIRFGFSCNSGHCSINPTNIKLSHYVINNKEDDNSDFELSNIKDYATIKYQEGNCPESVIDNVEFVNLRPDKLKIKWASSNESTISTDGTVTRGTKDTNVTVTAHINYKGNEYKNNFELTVKQKNNIKRSLLTDYSINQLDQINKNDSDYETEINDFGYIESVYGCFSNIKVDSYESALMSLYNIKSALGIKDPFSELKVKEVKYDSTGYIFKFIQMYEGMEVFDNRITVSSDENGKVDCLKSEYFPISNRINTVPKISKDDALKILKSKGYSNILLSNTNLLVLNYYGKCSIVWEFEGQDQNDNNKMYDILVDALTGQIDYKNKITNEARVSACGEDLLNNSRSFSVKRTNKLFMNEKYHLEDTKRNIEVYDANGTEKTSKSNIITNTSNSWSKTQVSAMANFKDIYDFYKDKLDRISYDDAWSQLTGNTIKVYINTSIENNAYWNGRSIWVGNGTGGTFKKASLAIGKDILAHEFTHAVVQDETSLYKIYCGTPGIIDEAYADIFGCYVDGDWKIGEDATTTSCLRNIESPYDTNNPIKVNGKNFVDYKTLSDLNDNGGIHQNSTLISHVAYNIQQKKLSKSAMKVWYKSLCLGYSKHTDLYDVRKTVIKAAHKLKCNSDDITKIKDCFDNANIKKSTCDESYNSYFKKIDKYGYSKAFIDDNVNVLGKVIEADKDFDYSNNKTLETVSIATDQNKNIGISDKNGDYNVSVVEDNPIVLNFEKKGYIGEQMYVPNVNAAKESNYYCDLVELIPNSQKGVGSASGYIKDSVTGKGIKNLTMYIRRGINNIYSDSVYEIQSTENGYYETPKLDAGNYCIEIFDDNSNYISTHFNIKIFGGTKLEKQNMSISNSLKKNQMRAVLTWGEKPRDLDAHISFDLSSGDSGHVFYNNKSYYLNGVCISKLDVDDRNGYGPETTTIYNDTTGDYTYYVKNYSKEIEMKDGGFVMVKVYLGNSAAPSYTFSMPCKPGTKWSVFKYNSSTGRIAVVNTVE